MGEVAGTLVEVAQVKRRRRHRDPGRGLFISLMLLPAVAMLAVYMFYPIFETIRLSFMKSTGVGSETFIGLENYKYLFTNDEFLQALLHVFQWAIVSVVIQLPLAFFVAFSLIVYRNRVTKPLRAIYYLANIMPSAITAMLGNFIFSSTNGALTSFANLVGMKGLASVDWMGNGNIAFWTVFIIATWTYTGFPIVYLMARIEQIPSEIREAAQLDGAGGWAYAWHIVIPNVTYPLRILAVLMTIGSLKLFELPFLMTRGGPGSATKTLGIVLYNQGFVNWQYGSAAAIGVVIFVLSLVFAIVQFSMTGKESNAI